MKQRAILLLAGMGIALVLACAVALAADEPDYQARIVGGTAVSNAEYPFMASLQERKPGQPPAKGHFCGGTLVDRDSVLTAAHCALYIKREIPARKLRIVVGPTVLNSDQGQARNIASLSDISIHPRYQGAGVLPTTPRSSD
jgi:secreted trypsin-like serine protease